MPFMLVALLTFALLVTLAGFVLSIKPFSRSSDIALMYPRTRDRRTREPLPRRSARSIEMSPRRDYRRASVVTSVPGLGLRARDGARPTKYMRGSRGHNRRVSLLLIGLIAIFSIGLIFLTNVLPRNPILNPIWFMENVQSNPQASSQPQQSQQTLPTIGASSALVRLGQLDHAQYNSSQEWNTWAYSACSAAAMTEVFNAYGRHYRITDVLQVEARIGEITPSLGLVEDIGIQRTAAQFGFNTSWGYKLSLDQVIAMANSGRPVIVSWPPSKYDGGHLLVVVGGNSSLVYLADSSAYNRTQLTHAQFMNWWGGFSAIVTPK